MKRQIKLALLTALAVSSVSLSQEGIDHRDHLFAASGRSMVTVSTGIPYVGIAEYAYGVSDRFSLGVVAGLTPNVEGYGVRIRAILSQPSESFRVYFRAPLFYYPKTRDLGGDPWILTWPVLSGEWALSSGERVSVGGGFIVASCFDSFARKFGLQSEKQGDEMEEGFMGGVWNTVHAGAAFPVSQNLMFQAEASYVMHGVGFANRDWVGGPPVILVLGLSRSF